MASLLRNLRSRVLNHTRTSFRSKPPVKSGTRWIQRYCRLIRYSRSGVVRNTAATVVLGSPLLLTDYSENNPISEVVLLSGKALGFLTEKIFENESGQSMMLGLFLISIGFASVYFNGMTAYTVRKMQIHHATKFGQIGVPFYTSRALPPNPLLKVKKAT
ncbi:uncharacterized protein LOC129617678 [Condylostylus longicornis]|uniref:uncharacterized protein LOC129617678 n=1 Tax=Condylostylus longicornis TaxID=2530218 RepID=UPI00244E0D06|nr:uncharacterized protein LOC129617678 [Condylostylus longicornis]